MDIQRYQQIKNGLTWFQVSDAGMLFISGADRVGFLQRQSTNNLDSLKPDECITTVLTSPAARILDVLQVIVEPDGQTLAVVTLTGRSNRTLRYLQSRIFFMDKVVVEPGNVNSVHFMIHGKDAERILFADELAGVGNLLTKEVKRFEYHGHPALFLRDPLRSDSYRLIIPSVIKEPAIQRFKMQGLSELSEDEEELLRIEAGVPGVKNELTEEFTPLEMKLQGFVSSNKGCYTGQEIIARQITYDKVTRQLVGLRLEVPVQISNPILSGEKPIGVVTSTVVSPAYGAIALAVIKRPFFEPGTQVILQTEQGNTSGQTCELPFR